MSDLLPDKNRRVLVIDDNRAIHDDFRKILSPATAAKADFEASEVAVFGEPMEAVEQTGFEVTSADQGQEGVLLAEKALAAGLPFAVAFVDVRMPPGWDGVETTRKLWELDASLQVVLCTAYSDYSCGELFKQLGHHDGLLILKKPFDAVEALQLAHALTEKWWLHQQSRQKLGELEHRVVERTAELARTNDSLQRQQTELRVVFDLMPAMIWFKDTQNGILRVNQRVAEAAGRTIEEIEGQPSQEIYPEEAARFYADDLNVIQSGKPKLGYVESMRGPDGREVWVQTDKVPYHDKDGKVVGIVVMAQDITERKRASALLRESEQRLSLAREAAHMGIWDWDVKADKLVWDAQMYALYGIREQDFSGAYDAWQKGLHPEDRKRGDAAIHAALDGSRDFHIEFRVVWPGGEVRHLEAHALVHRSEDGSVVRMIGANWDITPRKQAEESLRLFASAVEQAGDSILITDAELDLPGPRIVFANPAFTLMTGYTAEEILGKTPRILQGPRTDRVVLDRLRQNLARGEIFSGETINYRKDGTEFTIAWQVGPIRDAEEKITHFVAIQHDISERKMIEERLVQSQRLETVGKLAGGIAHEFNSILTAIIGQSELLLADLPPGSPLGRNVIEISQAAIRAATLTRQLLAYGRKQILQPEALDLNRLLGGMEEMLLHLTGVNIVTRIVPASELQTVKADAGQMEEVIVNMVINARDAMPAGGLLTLETSSVLFDQDSVGRYPELKPGGYVVLAITDTGAGMSEAVKARAFDPFFTTKGIGQGTGLGLSTCYGIVKQTGGHISVYSEAGRGTTFKIYLPLAEPVAKVPPKRPAPSELPRGTETILLVEDDPALREMATTLLSRLGYTVLAAANGVEALTLKQQSGTGHIDLLFTDVVMPHMSGKELADRMRASFPRTRILFTSAYAENAIVHQGALDPGVTLLQKPFTPSALARMVRETLDRPATTEP